MGKVEGDTWSHSWAWKEDPLGPPEIRGIPRKEDQLSGPTDRQW